LMEMDFANSCPLVRPPLPHIRYSVRRITTLLHASFRRALAEPPLRFTSASPPSGCTGDFHPQAVGHVRHTGRFAPLARWPEDGPSLTAAVRGGAGYAQVGTEGWCRSNKRMAGSSDGNKPRYCPSTITRGVKIGRPPGVKFARRLTPLWQGFVGPAGVLDRGKGTGWSPGNLRDPTHVHVRERAGKWDRRLNK